MALILPTPLSAIYLVAVLLCNFLQLIHLPFSENFSWMECWCGGINRINPSGHYGFHLHQLNQKTFLGWRLGWNPSAGHFCLLSSYFHNFRSIVHLSLDGGWGGGFNPIGNPRFHAFILSHFQKYSSTFLGWRLVWWLRFFWPSLLSLRPHSSSFCSGLPS